MATMNKPAANDPNWYQAVTDNWTSIEKNLVDKSIFTAKGDLIAATAPGTPTRVGVGANGRFVVADTSQASGIQWADLSTVKPQVGIDLQWGKKFFSDNGFLPSTKMFEYVGTPPVFTGTAGAATWTRDPGAMRPNNTGIGWYDLGSDKTRILFVAGNVWRLGVSGSYMHLTQTAPIGIDPDGYSIASGDLIYLHAGGAYTELARSGLTLGVEWMSGYAMYFDAGQDSIRMFVRIGTQWFQISYACMTANQFNAFRYLAFQSNAANQRFATPFVCYAD